MGWSEAVITLDGIALVTELINGGKLKITRAEISENTVDAAALTLQKAVLSPLNVPVVIAEKEKRGNSLNICVQIHNTGAVGSHRMRQLGLYAQTETSEEKLFAILQNKIGEEIPPEDEYPRFLLEFTAVITVSNTDNISVTIEPASVIVTKDMLDRALANKADKSELPTTLPANGGNADTVNGHTVNADVPADAKFTDTVYKHPTTSGSKHIPSGGKSGQILRWSADGTAAWGADNDTTYSAMTGATASKAGAGGLVPTPGAGKQESYLRGDGKWENPLKPKNVTVENTDLNDYTASGIYYFSGNYTPAKNLPLSTITNGWLVVIEAFSSSGIKQFWIRYGTPNSNDHQTFVRTRINSTWGNWKRFATEDEIPSYSAATQSKTGLMTAADKTKLDGIAENANKYTHPTTAGNKHIPAGGKSGQILRWSADGTAAWGADNDTTYSAMTGATETAAGKSGLVPAPPKDTHLHNYLKANGQFANPLNPISITTDGTNLNDYKTSGIYYFGSEHTPSNTPGELVNGWLIVIRYSENTIKQIILRGGTANSNDFNTYVRTFLQGNTWSDWKKFVTVPPTVNPRLIVNIVQGELGDNGGTNNVSYQAGATRALVFGWKNGVINNVSNQAFGSILLTGLSASMTAKSGTSICVGASTSLSASVNSTGTISLSGSGGQKYMVVWLS